MRVFINNAIHNGILSYLNYINNKDINKLHIFEFSIIKVLVHIYGEINIINPFKIGKEDSFRKNISLYGLKDSDLEMFIKYMKDYDAWLNSTQLVNKTILPNQISAIMINMILLKSNFQNLTEEEIRVYDEFFDPKNNDMLKIQSLILEDQTLIPSLWKRKRNHFTNDLILEEIEAELLSKELYQSYGLEIEEVRNLSNLKIKEINAKIMAEEAEKHSKGKSKFDPRKLILTSGSGFVDTIVLLSIMVTEIMVGLIIAFSFLRR